MPNYINILTLLCLSTPTFVTPAFVLEPELLLGLPISISYVAKINKLYVKSWEDRSVLMLDDRLRYIFT